MNIELILKGIIERKEIVTCCLVSPKGAWAIVTGKVTLGSSDDYNVDNASGCSIVFSLSDSIVRHCVSKGHVTLRIE